MNQITKSPSYLIRNPHSYCFRMSVPKDLHSFIKKREIRWSLKTGSLKDAKFRASALGYEFNKLFLHIRSLVSMQELGKTEISDIVNRFIQDLFDQFEAVVRARSISPDKRKRLARGMEFFANGIPNLFKEELIAWDNSNVESCVDRALMDSGLDIDRISPSYGKLCRQMKIKLVQFCEIEQKRQKVHMLVKA